MSDNQDTELTGDATAKAGAPRSGIGQLLRRAFTSFRVRVTLGFVGVALVAAVLFSVILTTMWNSGFNDYTRENMEQVSSAAAKALANEYDLRGYWSTRSLQSALLVDELFDGLGIQVLNSSGTPIYDNTWLTESNISLAPDSAAMVSQQIISASGVQVGTVRVWAMGSDALLTPKDISFRESSLRGIFIAALAGIIFAVISGLLFSNFLTRPIKGITSAATRIKEGDLAARSEVFGSDDIGQLGETFDEMADSLEKDRELEKRLTADVAHELRTPLMSIMATVEAMQDEVMPCDQEHLALVDNEVKRLSRLVDSMLRLSRLESRSVHMDFQPTDIVDFTYGLVIARTALMADAGLTLEFENETGEDEFEAEIDHDTITQAVTNLLSNAMRYTPAPGRVTVKVSGDDDEARISVTDTGVGISKENLKLVFSRFWRAEESRNRAKGGLGVGLAVTKEIVDNHHGRIDVDSELGEGTTFTIRLPRRQPRAAQGSQAS